MFRNYFVTAFRYLWKQKGFSVINLTGLTVGLSVCYFALSFVSFEMNYDRYHEKSDRIYRLVTDVKTTNSIDYLSTTATMAPGIQAAFPEIQAATRIFLDHLIIQKDEGQYADEQIAYADSSLFSVFTFPLISGNPDHVLTAPYTLVLSETSARKYFGEHNPIGRTLLVNGKERAQVTGVMKDMPQNSHFRVDMLVSMSTLGEEWMRNSKRFFFYTYLLLPENYDASRLSAKFPGFVKTYIEQNQDISLALEPLKSVYFDGKPRGSKAGSSSTGNRSHIYIFSFVAAFVLFIACFNFINLTTALSMQRAKEIGVRKVLGTTRKLLVLQFLLEAVSLSLIAFCASLIISSILIPSFNNLTGKVVSTGVLENTDHIFILFAAAIMIGLLSGIYPAFFLSRFQPASTLKGGSVSVLKGAAFRKVLVTVQFSISVILMVATIVVYRQLDFMQNQALGFRKEHHLIIDFQYDDHIISHQQSVKEKLMRIPGITMTSISSSIPGRANHLFPTQIENIAGEMQEFQSDTYFVDYNFIKQYGVSMRAGRSFSSAFGTDLKEAIVINESAVKSLGFSHAKDVLGKRFSQLKADGTVIGVIKDFHFRSFQEKVQPLTLRVAPGFFTYLTLSISGEHIPETIARLEKEWKTLMPGLPLIYFFADEIYDHQYQSEQRFGKLFLCFSTLAIFISCLGLLGLSAFSITQRTREVGIRKVMGASAAGIVGLLSIDFIKLVFFAILIATPVAWYLMDQWLLEFAYRIEMPWWGFIVASAIAVLIAATTVSIQAVKAAFMDPVKSLRA